MGPNAIMILGHNLMTEQYFSFLLRLWRTSSQEDSIWRVTLENPHTHEIIGFDGLETLLVYLQDMADQQPADPHDPDSLAGNQ
jgi:hypothetical protein